MTALDQIAPFPREDEVTANRMVTFLASHAYLLYRRQIDDVPDRDRSETGVLFNEYGAVYLLRRLIDEVGSEKADDVARDLWWKWGDGEGLGLDLARWLREYDVEPGQITDLAVQAEPQAGESRG